MRRVFLVKLYLQDGSQWDEHVEAKDDTQAREKAVRKLKKSFISNRFLFPGVDFAEITWVCDLMEEK